MTNNWKSTEKNTMLITTISTQETIFFCKDGKRSWAVWGQPSCQSQKGLSEVTFKLVTD